MKTVMLSLAVVAFGSVTNAAPSASARLASGGASLPSLWQSYGATDRCYTSIGRPVRCVNAEWVGPPRVGSPSVGSPSVGSPPRDLAAEQALRALEEARRAEEQRGLCRAIRALIDGGHFDLNGAGGVASSANGSFVDEWRNCARMGLLYPSVPTPK